MNRPLILIVIYAALSASASAQRPKVALVLSGGGARGAAHIGVLHELEAAGIPIDFVAGASYGAFVGGLYAVGYSPSDLEAIVRDIDWSRLFDSRPDRRLLNWPGKQRADRGLFRLRVEDLEVSLPAGIENGQRVRQLVSRLAAVPVYQAGNDFDRLRIPFRAVASDLLRGRVHVFDSGSLATALRASMAVPGVFTPVEFADTLLVDGGLLDNLPVSAALQWGADIVIAVDVSTPPIRDKSEIRSLVDVLDQSISLHIEAEMAKSRKLADLVIAPELEGFTSAMFERSSQMIPAGRRAARQRLAEIKKLLTGSGISLPASPPTPSLIPAGRFDDREFVYAPKPVQVASVEVDGADEELAGEVLDYAARPLGEAGADDLRRVDRSVSVIYGSNLFDAVHFKLEPRTGQARLAYEVDRAPPTQIGLGLRYDKEFQFTGAFQLASRRLGGTDFDGFATALVGNARSLELGLEGGSASGRELFPSTSFRFRTFDRLLFQGDRTIGDFQDQRIAWGASLNRLLGNGGRLQAGYRVEQVNIARGLGAFSQPSSDTLSGLHAAANWDSLDHSDFPRRGLYADLRLVWQDEALGSDFSFWKAAARLEQRLSFGPAAVGLGGSWRIIAGDAPFYELAYSGGRRYFDFAAAPFAGLRRDEAVSKNALIAELSYRHLLYRPRFGMLKAIYADGVYNAGFLSPPDSRDLGGIRRGAAFGASFDIRYMGPVRVLLGKAEESDWTSYFSIGHRF